MKTQRFFASLLVIAMVGTTAIAQIPRNFGTSKTIKFDAITYDYNNNQPKDTTRYEIYFGTPTDSAFLIVNKYSKGRHDFFLTGF